MENASKALLMAAGMLLVVMIASVFALMYSTMSEYTKEYDRRKQTEELQAFNGQFEKYVHEGATAQDVVTVINLAKTYIEKMEYTEADTEYYIEVLGLGAINEKASLEIINEFLKDNSIYDDAGTKKVKKYNVNLDKSDVTGKVKSITFSE